MSYLHPVRLAFAGLFQADMSTVNNDVRHYDNASFEPVFQDLQKGPSWNGWWNPNGSGAFRFVGCKVTAVWYGDGTSTSDPAEDPVVGMTITGADARTAGKLVDIDPQWQLASAPWGLKVRLTDGNGPDVFSGSYLPNAFRDLWFSRGPAKGGDGAASSTFQSVIEGLSWNAGVDSRFARELQATTTADALSIRMATFGYVDDITDPMFTLGTMIGCIGPYLEGEPTSFVRGRRFVPAGPFTSWNGMTYFSGHVDTASSTLLLDLSNAFAITDRMGTPNDIGDATIGILRDPMLTENMPVSSATFLAIADVPYKDPNWLARTGGVFATPLTAEQLQLAADHPLALVTKAPVNPGVTGDDLGTGLVAIREAADGLLIEAEPAVHRIDAPGTSSVAFIASRYGVPLANATVTLTQTGKVEGQGGGQTSGPNTPTAPIPDMGVPTEAFVFPPTTTTDDTGVAIVQIEGKDPGNPRGYIDGQVYLMDFRVEGMTNPTRQPFDFVVVHIRDAVEPNPNPTWDDVGPILTQYGNLYPLMDSQIVNLRDPVSVAANKDVLELVFNLDPSDSNYMPVTRDLSAGKRDLILRWLANVPDTVEAAAPRRAAAAQARPSPAAQLEQAGPAADGIHVDVDSKQVFADNFLRALRGGR